MCVHKIKHRITQWKQNKLFLQLGITVEEDDQACVRKFALLQQ